MDRLSLPPISQREVISVRLTEVIAFTTESERSSWRLQTVHRRKLEGEDCFIFPILGNTRTKTQQLKHIHTHSIWEKAEKLGPCTSIKMECKDETH